MSKLRKIFTISVMAITVLSLSIVVAPDTNAAASAGDLIKMDGLSTVYYLGADGKRYVFPNETTYFSWYSDWSGVVTVPQSELETYLLGANVVIRSGTKLVKITTNPTVYAVEPNGVLRSIVSEENATNLYGANWIKRVVDVPDAFFTNYTIGDPLTVGAYPAGQLIKATDSADVYYVNADNTISVFDSEASFLGNRFSFDDVVTTATDYVMPTAGDALALSDTIIDTSQGGGGGSGIQPGVGTGLTVALSADTAASVSYIRDTGGLIAQAVAPFTTLNFTAAADGDVKVTNLKLTRSGISADSDLGTIYLYDGDTQIAEHTSFSSKIVTFNNLAGLFTVPAGTTKSVIVKADLAAINATVSGIILGVNAASDVTTNGASVSGSFPINGNQMSVATVADMGYVDLTSFTTFPATMDPGKTNEEVWRFSAQANDQDMSVKYIKMTVVGTVATTDLANFKLEVAGTQIGSTVANMNTGNEVIFDLSASPYLITSGQTKVITVKADILGGSSRTFKLTIRKVSDFITTDNNYGIQVKPLKDGIAFTLIEPETGSGTGINAGTLTVAVASDSVTGNIPSGSTDVSLAKFTYKANGEDIKVTAVNIKVNEETGNKNLKNGKLYWDGSQVGNTDTSVLDEVTVVYALNQVIPAGQTVTLEYKANTIDDTGANLAAGQTVVVSLIAGTTDATGQSSLSSVATAAATGRTLTVATGLATVAKNGSLADYVVTTNPTGVVGATNAKVGSIIITAGSGEGVTVNQLVIGDDGEDVIEYFGDNFQNLTLKNVSGTQLATTQGTLSGIAGADYTFSLSPSISIAAGQQYVVDIYADILTGAGGYAGARTGLEFVNMSATGALTSSDAYPTATIVNLQNLVIAASGSLTVIADSTTPTAAQVVMGQTDVEFAKLKLTAGASEDINVNTIVLTDTSANATGLSNVKLYNGSTMVGSSVATFNATTNGTATFNLVTPLVIAKGQSTTLTVKANVNAYPNATSAGTHVINLASNADITSIGAASGVGITETVTAATGATMTAYKTKVSIAKDVTSPSGASTATVNQTVLVFNVINTGNTANQDATVSDLALNLSTSGAWTTTTVRTIKVYKNSVSTANLVGTKTFAVANALASVAFDGYDAGASLTDVAIGSGSTVKFIVLVDSNEAPTTTGRLTVSIPSTNGIEWTDGVTADIVTVDTLPLDGGTLTY